MFFFFFLIKEKEDGRIEGQRKRKKQEGQEGEVGREVWSREKEEEDVEGTMLHLTLLLSTLNPVYTYTTQILLFFHF